MYEAYRVEPTYWKIVPEVRPEKSDVHFKLKPGSIIQKKEVRINYRHE